MMESHVLDGQGRGCDALSFAASVRYQRAALGGIGDAGALPECGTTWANECPDDWPGAGH